MQKQIDEQKAEIVILRERQAQAADMIRQYMAMRTVHDPRELARFEEIARDTFRSVPNVVARPALVVRLLSRGEVLDQDLYTQHSQLDRIMHRFLHRSEPTEVLMYMNPRDQVDALLDLHDTVVQRSLSSDPVPERLDHALVQGVYQGKQLYRYIELVINTKDPDVVRRCKIDGAAFMIESKVGYHVVWTLERFPMDKASFYAHINGEIRTDVCVPVPGTLQDGFPVRLISLPASS